MFRFAFRLVLLAGLVVGSAAVLSAAPNEMEAVANAGWEEIGVGSASGGGISHNGGPSSTPALAVGPDGMPVVAWIDESDGDAEVYVRRWNGSTWVELAGSASGGGISNNSGGSVWPTFFTLAIDPGGAPIVAWNDNSGGDTEIYVRRWNGLDWAEIGIGSASGGGISNNNGDSYWPSLAIGPDGAPVVAWQDGSSGNREIYVRRWNGTAWVGMDGSASGGGISNTNNSSFDPSLAIDPSGAAVVAWEENTEGVESEIYIRRWNGANWVEIGAGSASGDGLTDGVGSAVNPSLAIAPNGAPVVAWDMHHFDFWNDEVYVRRWNGTAWAELGGSPSAESGIGSGYSSSLAIGSDGTPIVAFYFSSIDGGEVYVRRWNGTTWAEMNSGSASSGGVSNDEFDSQWPSIAIGPNDDLVIAWDSQPHHEIYVRRYQPCTPSWQNYDRQSSLSSAFAPASPHTLFLPSVLHVLRSYFAGPDELEPNNHQGAANGPLCSGRVYTGLPTDRFDVFFFEAAAGPVTTNLTNHTGSGVQLQLHHQTITSHPIAIDVNGADGYRIELPNAPAGRYYVVISTLTPNPNTATRYQLTPTFNMSR